MQAIEFALTVPTTLDHRSARVTKVFGQPLLAQHRNERGQKRNQQTCIREIRDRDNLLRGASPHRRGSGVFARRNGWVEAKKDGSEVGSGPFAVVWLELRLDGDGEGGADCGKQTSLRTWLTVWNYMARVATDGY